MKRVTRPIRLCAVAVLLSTAAQAADPAVRFGRFLGAVLAVEDACAAYYARTDATMGNHLTPKDYQHAMTKVEDERKKAARLVKSLGCEKAAAETMKLTDLSFFEVWEIRE